MEIIFLGTSCMVPTKERNHQSIFIPHKEEGILVDCGEGTQRQFKIADIKPTKITKILLTHWHGDHVLGLPGLLQTLNASEYDRKLEIFGPVGTKEYFNHMFKAFSFNINFNHEIREISDGETLAFRDITVLAKELSHGVPCLGYLIKENDKKKIKVAYIKKLGIPDGPLLGDLQNNKNILWKGKTILSEDATFVVEGKKIAVVLDTLLCNGAYELSKHADLLICEAVYTSKLIGKAEEYKHMTAMQAGELAATCGVKKLVLTHFSQRYKTTEEVLDEAKSIFKATSAAYDFMKLKI